MFEKHPQFISPNEETVLWRYLNFAKFASLFDKKALYFCRADLLGDPFEGSYPKGSQEALEQHYKEMKYSERLLNILKAYSRNSRKQMYINCWHMNPVESDAMWNRYTSNGLIDDGVAICTTFKKLSDCFSVAKERIFIGQIFYIDYNTTLWMSTLKDPDTEDERAIPAYGGGFHAVLHKQNTFEHERELRCLFWQPHFQNDKIDLSARDINAGHYIQVDLESLVDAIYIAPNAGAWFRELVESFIKKAGYSFPVNHSVLSEDPIF